MLLTIAPFAATYGKYRYITPNISEYSGLIITNFTGLVGIWMEMIIPIFVWRSLNCYATMQLNLEAVRRRREDRPLLFALAFDNGSDDREATFKGFNGNSPAT